MDVAFVESCFDGPDQLLYVGFQRILVHVADTVYCLLYGIVPGKTYDYIAYVVHNAHHILEYHTNMLQTRKEIPPYLYGLQCWSTNTLEYVSSEKTTSIANGVVKGK